MSKKLITTILMLYLSIVYVFSQTPKTDLNWQLNWEDQFHILDSNRWDVKDNATHGQEPQLYKKDNVFIRDNCLTILTNNRQTPYANSIAGHSDMGNEGKLYHYTSGWIETSMENAIHYGFCEARVKIPYYRGLWPAFWTLIKQGLHYEEDNRTASEIDIFEMYGHKPVNHYETNIHHTYDYQIESATTYKQNHNLNNFSYEQWHTYAIEWDTFKIIWYLDDVPIRLLYNHGIFDSVRVILNVAIENNIKYWPEFVPYFEQYMLVDYVKTYTLKCDKRTNVVDIPDFNAYDFSVKKNITLTGNTTIPVSSHISLRATDYIELQAGFETSFKSDLYLDVCQCNENEFNNRKR